VIISLRQAGGDRNLPENGGDRGLRERVHGAAARYARWFHE
jgi:hypothetical protein